MARTFHRDRDRDVAATVRALRAAVSAEPANGARRTARLDDLTLLGELLGQLGEMAEAENVLRQALGERAAFYGVQHPGYAFGLAALASFELSRGRFIDARCLCDQALHVLLEAGHPRAAEVAALRAFAVVAESDDASLPYACADQLDQRALTTMIHAVLDRAEYADPRHALAALNALRPLATRRLGDEHELALHIVVAISNRARDTGDHELRIEAFIWLIAALDRSGDALRAVDAVLGLALAASDAGQPQTAELHHRDALARAAPLGAAARSRAVRDFGLFLASTQRWSEAEQSLLTAVAEARQTGDSELLGRALIALGIFQDHGGQRSLARETLSAGLRLVAYTDLDALCGRNHLDAIERGAGCGCAPELTRDSPDCARPNAARRA